MMKIIDTKLKNTPTLEVLLDNKRIYIHSKYNPIREAELFAKANYINDDNVYIVYGLGLGYHIIELYKLIKDNDNKSQIYVYESNKEVYKIAQDQNIIKKLEQYGIQVSFLESLQVIIDDIKSMDDNKLSFVVHNQSLKLIPIELEEFRKYLEEVIVNKNSSESSIELLEDNFKKNIENYDEIVNVLFRKYKNIPSFLVSAGPSLDLNIDILKKIYDSKKGLILSVGRSVNALINKEIYPDYIIVTDPKDTVYKNQLSHLNLNIPVIGLSTVDNNLFKFYKSKKIIAFQEGFELAEEFASLNKIDTVNTGGSVATTMLDIAIKMGGNPIIFVGQDLGYTNSRSHSKDSNFKNIKSNKINRLEKDIFGQDIYTSKNLSIYRRWIESRISKEKDIDFIDGTEGGLMIDGTKIRTLEEIFDDLS